MYERLTMYHEALTDWDHYLRIDPKGEWSGEARRRRDAVDQFLKSHAKRGADSARLDPLEFVGFDAGKTQKAMERAESYLDAATAEWLPAARRDADKTRALAKLAAQFDHFFHDEWLHDLLAVPTSAKFADAAATLAIAIHADGGNDIKLGIQRSQEAQTLFEATGSRAGALRAAFEHLYALHRSGDARRCVESAERLKPSLAGRRYRWLEIRLGIEYAGCLGALGEDGAAQREAKATAELARASGYPILRLFALNAIAAIATHNHDMKTAWAADVEGLKTYWAGDYPAIRAQNFYNDLRIAAENSDSIPFALALAREGSRVLASYPNLTAVATSHFHVGRLANLDGAADEALRELTEANRLFAQLPSSKATDYYLNDCRIWLADLAVRQKDVAAAQRYLQEAHTGLEGGRNYAMVARYFKALSDVSELSGDSRSTEEAIRARVAIAELSLRSFWSDRDRLIWSREMSDAYYKLAEIQWSTHRDPEAALETIEAFRGGSLRFRSLPPPGSDSAPIESELRIPDFRAAHRLPSQLETGVVLVYALLPGGASVWVVDRNAISTQRLTISVAELRRLAREFLMDCANPDSDRKGLDRKSHHLYDALISPIEGRLAEGTPVLLDIDPEIAVPFAALADSQGNYFGARHAIALARGVAYRQIGGPPRSVSRDQHVLAVGAPALRGLALPPLPDAVHEARAVAERFTGARLLTGADATLDSVEKELSAASLFHFAGHSATVADRVGLLMAGDAEGRNMPMLDAKSIAASQLSHCALAVLSACSTEGLGDDSASDPDSLVFGFLPARAFRRWWPRAGIWIRAPAPISIRRSSTTGCGRAIGRDWRYNARLN